MEDKIEENSMVLCVEKGEGLVVDRLYVVNEVGEVGTINEGCIKVGTYNSGVEQWVSADYFVLFAGPPKK